MIYRDNVVVLNEKGDQVFRKQLKKRDDKFEFKNKTYVLDRKEDNFIKVKGLFRSYRYYVYNIKNIRPLSLTAEPPKFSTEQLTMMLKTKVLKDLNMVKKDFKLDWKIVIGVLVVLAIIIYFLRGGTLA